MVEALTLLKDYPDLRSRYLRFRYSPPLPQGTIPSKISILVNGQPYFKVRSSGIALHHLALVTAIAVEEVQLNSETYFLRVGDRVILDRLGAFEVPCLK